MRDLNYFAHESPTPHLHSPAQRYEYAFGFEPRFISENVAWRSSGSWSETQVGMQGWIRSRISPPVCPTQEDVEASHQGLINSPGHRANILEPTIDLVGIGLVSREGKLWVTQMFAWRANGR